MKGVADDLCRNHMLRAKVANSRERVDVDGQEASRFRRYLFGCRLFLGLSSVVVKIGSCDI